MDETVLINLKLYKGILYRGKLYIGNRVENPKASNKRERKTLAENDDYRDWANLHHAILHRILHTLLLSSKWSGFGKVCKSWSSFHAFSKDNITSSHPPFLLIPFFLGYDQDDKTRCELSRSILMGKQRSVHDHVDSIIAGWIKKHGPVLRGCCTFRILSPAAPGTDAAIFSAQCLQPVFLPNSQLQFKFDRVYASNGYILSINEHTKRLCVTNPFNGEEHWPFPELPTCSDTRKKCTILIWHLLPHARAVIFCNHNVLWTCDSKMKQKSWDRHYCPGYFPIRFANIGQRLFCLSCDGSVYSFNYEKYPGYCKIGMGGLSLKDAGGGPFKSAFFPFLFASGGNLFLLHCVAMGPPYCQDDVQSLSKFEIYKLSGREWIKCNKLHNSALFVDSKGQATCCINLSQWGGKENTMYLIGPSNEKCEVFCLDQPVNLNRLPKPSTCLGQWPRPLWMLPFSCY